MTRAPKPASREGRVGLLGYMRLFRQDILSAQPERLYGAWMADFRTPFFRSLMMNDPSLIKEVLKERPDDFPKSNRVREGLAPLLGNSVFLTNGEEWKAQRRIIDPAFEGGRVKASFPAMLAAAEAGVARLAGRRDWVEIEEVTSHIAADVIFRTLFSVPIEDQLASEVFAGFRAYQRTQPLLNIAAFLPLPKWMPRAHKRETREAAQHIRGLIREMVERRAAEIEAGTAPDDLATKIMTTPDPQTGRCFTPEEMVDQVAIFFLAGHETSASALAWALYLLAIHPEIQARVRTEVGGGFHSFSALSKLSLTRNVFREALRLYSPVPMMVRETTRAETFRGRQVKKGTQLVLSPWHVNRHTRLWQEPDLFDPDRWEKAETQTSARDAYLPFSTGPRVCPGAGFAMAEGPLLLAALVGAYQFEADPERPPVPVAHLTVRAKEGIWLRIFCENSDRFFAEKS